MLAISEYNYRTIYKVGALVRSGSAVYRVVPMEFDGGLTAGQNRFLFLDPPYTTERGNSILLDISL